jgi:hypothetical protein
VIKAKAARGLKLSLVQAEEPLELPLGFRSPYGYSVATLIGTFDYYVRVMKTMERKDLLSDKSRYDLVFKMTRECRSIFEAVVVYQRKLMRPELANLSRSDWLPMADDLAKKRVHAAVVLFGELPREVFNGTVAPKHSRRRLDISAQELRLLNEVPLAPEEALQSAAMAGLVA